MEIMAQEGMEESEETEPSHSVQWNGISLFEERNMVDKEGFNIYVRMIREYGLARADQMIQGIAGMEEYPDCENIPPVQIREELIQNARTQDQKKWIGFICSYLEVYYRWPTPEETRCRKEVETLFSICRENPVILTNAPGGCGKSWLISQVRKFVRSFVPLFATPAWDRGKVSENWQSEHSYTIQRSDFPVGRMGRVAVLAPSGVAAANAGAYTFHDALRTFPITFESVRSELSPVLLKPLAADFAQVVCVLVEEFSMVSLELLSYLDKILRAVRPDFSNVMFGGIPVIMMGDAFQLPVVNGQGLMTLSENVDKRSRAVYEHCTTKCFLPYLEESVRHEGDDRLRNCLLRVRRALALKEDVRLLNARGVNSIADLEEQDSDWAVAQSLRLQMKRLIDTTVTQSKGMGTRKEHTTSTRYRESC